MNETNWISLSERKPTAEDADEFGCVWWSAISETTAFRAHWNIEIDGATDFMPIPKRVVPPLPKPVEKTQRELDKDAYQIFRVRRDSTITDDVLDAMQWARAEERAKHVSSIAAERKRFAAQCLGIGGLLDAAQVLEDQDYEVLPAKLRALHKLLTEAAS